MLCFCVFHVLKKYHSSKYKLSEVIRVLNRVGKKIHWIKVRISKKKMIPPFLNACVNVGTRVLHMFKEVRGQLLGDSSLLLWNL